MHTPDHRSLIKKLHSARRRTDRIHILNCLCETSYRSTPQSALEYAMKGYSISKELQDPIARADSLTQIAACHHVLGNYTESNTCLDKAFLLYSSNNNDMGVAMTLHKKGGIALELGDYESALLASATAKKIWKQQNSSINWQHSAIVHTGALIKTGDYAKSLEQLYDLLQLARITNDTINTAVALADIATIYLCIGESIRARSFAYEAISKYELAGDRAGKANALLLLGASIQQTDLTTGLRYFTNAYDIHFNIGERKGIALSLLHLSSVHEFREAFENALSMAMNALEVFQRLSHRENIIKSKLLIGQIQYKLGMFTESERQFLEALNLARQIRNNYLEQSALTHIVPLYESQNKLSNAYVYLKELKEKDTSIAAITLARKITQIETQEQLRNNITESVQEGKKQLSRHFPHLSKTELTICTLIKERHSSKEIALALNISVRTVESHRLHIRTKLNLEKQVDLEAFLLSV